MPNSVKKIGAMAFMNCSVLTKVTLSKILVEIGPAAFINCENIENIVLLETLEKNYARAFEGCKKLEINKISKSVISISKDAFDGCPQMQSDNGYVIIDDILFDYVGNMVDIIIQDSVRRINEECFYNKVIENITLPKNLEETVLTLN